MTQGSYVLLSGGVGGSRMADGLARCLPPGALSIVVNTGDDFRHLGLHISPDIDTVCYMLSGLVNQQNGWGRGDESWTIMETLRGLGGPDWFQLGDRDLALHLLRSGALGEGRSLTDITFEICERMSISQRVLPMTDTPVATLLETDQGTLDFQTYFVAKRCPPEVRKVVYHGADETSPSPAVLDALDRPDLRGIVIAPSNPFLSIGPMLALRGFREALRSRGVPVVAVSPLIRGNAVKGPAAKIMAELGLPPDAGGVAQYYQGLADALIVDPADADFRVPGVDVLAADILMPDAEGRLRLGRTCLNALEGSLTRGHASP